MPDSNSQKILAFIKQVAADPLPVLNATVPKVAEELKQDSFNYERLGQLVHLDPMCLFNFLACANNHKQELSPDSEEKIHTPKHAALLLGIENIDRCLKDLKPLKSIKNQAIAKKLEQLACRGLHTAFQARNLAQIMRSRSAEAIYLSALMMPLADLLAWHIAPKKAQKVELLVFKEQQTEEEAQFQVFGFTYKDLIIAMASDWHLPEMYLTALQTDILSEAKKSIFCIKLAAKLAEIVDFGWYNQQAYDYYDFCEQMTPFHLSRLVKEFQQTALHMAWEAEEYYQSILPAIYLVLQEGKVPYQQVLSLESASQQKQSALDSTIVQLNSQVGQDNQVRVNKNMESASNIPTLIQLTLNALYDSDFYQQSIFLMLNKDKTDLIVRMGKGIDEKSIMLEKINVSREKNLFSILLEKPQSIFVKQVDFAKYEKFFTKEITTLLPAQEFCAKALFYHNKAIGLFYVTGQPALNKENYDFFRKTLVRFDQHLTRIK